MDWFRWWHGSSTDPKFRMISAECGLPLASILGLWAYILESASNNKISGQINNFDVEVASFHLGIDVVTPCNAMKRRNLFHETDGTLHVSNWDKWQPSREREDVSTASVLGASNDILDYLNEKTGRHYKPVKANIELIASRLKEGYSQDDLKAIVDRKSAQWGCDDKMNQYLRPSTLFSREKCAQYSGESGQTTQESTRDWI